MSAFVDILYPGETRSRHFKRLETFNRYDIYSQCSQFKIYNKNQILNEIPEYHYIVRQVRYVSLENEIKHPQLEDYYHIDYLISIRDELNEKLADSIQRV